MRIAPVILLGGGNVHRPRSHQGDEHMPIHGEIIHTVGVSFEIAIEPVREGASNGFNSLSELPANRYSRRRSLTPRKKQ